MEHLFMRVCCTCAWPGQMKRCYIDAGRTARLHLCENTRTMHEGNAAMKRNGGRACIGVGVYIRKCFTQGNPPGSNNYTVIQLILTYNHTPTERSHEFTEITNNKRDILCAILSCCERNY